MNNLYHLICENSTRPDLARSVLDQLAETSDFDLGTQARSLTDTQFRTVADWIVSEVLDSAKFNAIFTGALFHMFLTATQYGGRGELVAEFETKVKISRSQLYRLKDIHLSFGRLLIKEPGLRHRFPMESFKLLSSSGTEQAARDEATELARKGQAVTIKKAREIIAKHSLPKDPADHGERPSCDVGLLANSEETLVVEAPVASGVLWRYCDRLVRVIIEPASKRAVDLDAMIYALREALRRIEGERISDGNSPIQDSNEEQYADVG
ncbi:hypothetical protein [Rubripirellula reticaptiva]|uniref:Uncharacterized protein n=1 Tax=Rubripirellula reticaptiva TaxID=2528013 RepID=A0A5C6EMD0_9BACT|nr:hypothetical protein [Rubripirellula reticaptiva]TWU49504.1 hypothetical protein Poly59_41190 [Rubripirellula reticaptiva]